MHTHWVGTGLNLTHLLIRGDIGDTSRRLLLLRNGKLELLCLHQPSLYLLRSFPHSHFLSEELGGSRNAGTAMLEWNWTTSALLRLQGRS